MSNSIHLDFVALFLFLFYVSAQKTVSIFVPSALVLRNSKNESYFGFYVLWFFILWCLIFFRRWSSWFCGKNRGCMLFLQARLLCKFNLILIFLDLDYNPFYIYFSITYIKLLCAQEVLSYNFEVIRCRSSKFQILLLPTILALFTTFAHQNCSSIRILQQYTLKAVCILNLVYF